MKYQKTNEDEITCPKCGYVRHGGDSWESPDEGEDDCEECGHRYEWYRNVEVTYSTYSKTK